MGATTEDHRMLPRFDYLTAPIGAAGSSSSTNETRRLNFTIDDVVTDRDALDCFRAWMVDDPMRSADALDLHFAILGFKQAVEKQDPASLTIASQLHRRFISLKTGNCDFIPSSVRVDISNKVHGLIVKHLPPPSILFDQVQQYVWIHLRQQYALFTNSPIFNELVHRYANGFVQQYVWIHLRQQYALFTNSPIFNELVHRYANGFGAMPPSDNEQEGHNYVNDEAFEEMTIRHPTTLASSSVVGSSVVDDEAHPSTSQAKTLEDSMNALRISSGISTNKSEPNMAHKYKSGKNQSSSEDQFGGNTTTLVRKHKRENRERKIRERQPQQHSGMPHDRPEQRQEFASLLSQKLSEIAEEIAVLERHHGKTIYAREVVEYRNLAIDQPTFNQPAFGGPGWHPQTGMANSFHGFNTAHSGTQVAVAATSGFDADEEDEDLARYEQRLQQFRDRSNSVSPAPLNAPKPPIRDRQFSPYGGFAPPPQNCHKATRYPPFDQQRAQVPHFSYATANMPQSSAPPIRDRQFSPYGGFAPPPQNCHKATRYPPFDQQRAQVPHFSYATANMPQSSAVSYLSFSDSSGVFSAESAHVVVNPMDQFKMKRLFEKARENNAMANSQTMMRKQNSNPTTNHSQTLPRPSKTAAAQEKTSLQGPLMIVSLREPGQMPFVSKCEPKPLTFKEFRRLFGISSRSTKRIFFKSASDDPVDPYQWTAIDRDDQIVPQFEGRITAECRAISDSD
uniref:DIX domain-containing protein n=1 Tax=Panagrolaimus sp. JU765 TaxID=591449 RepID=A0AC34QS64_9BILA